MNKPKVVIDEKYQSKELYFDGKPDENTRTALKSHGFRWNPKKLCWYGFASNEDLEQIFGNIEETAALVIPESKFVDGCGLYDGWQGGKNRTWSSDKELKAFLADDFKKAGIKASIRFGNSGYLTSMYFTMRIDKSEIITLDEFKNKYTWFDLCHGCTWVDYTDENEKINCILIDKVYNMDSTTDESKAFFDNIVETRYKYLFSSMQSTGTAGSDKYILLTENAQKRMNVLQEIVSSYNRDCSNSQIDYFDRDIYDSYCIKIVA